MSKLKLRVSRKKRLENAEKLLSGHTEKIRSIEKQLGYPGITMFGMFDLFRDRKQDAKGPSPTMDEKVDMLISHLGLEMKHEDERHFLGPKKKQKKLPDKVVYKKRGLKAKIKLEETE